MSTTTFDPNEVNFNSELKKRRGSFPQVSNEILSAEMLAPIPQGNISRTISKDELNDESEPLLKVQFQLY